MSGWAAVGKRPDAADLRARRWDAVVLGSGIPALVAAARLGMAGHRVLVVEEAGAARLHPAIREPFLLAGALDGGVLDSCMRELTLPLIDRRRLIPQQLAYQVVGPDWRVDVGEPELTASELVAWGLAKPEAAQQWTTAYREAAESERERLLASEWVHAGGSLGRALGRGQPKGGAELALPEASGAAWQTWVEAQARALSHHAHKPPEAAARARLLGGALAGTAAFEDAPPWLTGLLRRRVESVYGEFRTLGRDFGLVSADGVPGVMVPDSRELWLGRALVIASPVSALARVLDPADRPPFIRATPSLRRHALHLRVRRRIIPEAMCQRVIAIGDPDRPHERGNLLTLALYRDREEPEWMDVVACLWLDPDEDPAPYEERALEQVLSLMPFSGEEGRDWLRRPVQTPRWDDDGWLEDGSEKSGAGDVQIRVSNRPAVYRLDRSGLGSLGLEGDLLLGWRGGDAIAAELA